MWADKGGRSVHALKSVDEHAQRRKIWDKAMSGASPIMLLLVIVLLT